MAEVNRIKLETGQADIVLDVFNKTIRQINT